MRRGLLLLLTLSEDNVAAVEPRGLDSRDEELRSVGVGAGVGHAQVSWTARRTEA